MRHNDILGLAWYGYGFRMNFGLGLLIICLYCTVTRRCNQMGQKGEPVR